jgi:four helix bundle protein
MSFKFQGTVIYEQLSFFAKDIFIFTGKLPNYESNGLIQQIRILASNLLTDYAEGNVRTEKSDPTTALDKCIIGVVKIASLVDLSCQLKYIDHTVHTKWMLICDEITKRLYETRKSVK